MKQYEVQDLMPVLAAWRAGKTIQCKYPLPAGSDWVDVSPHGDILFDLPANHYRIKPESGWRPFTADEIRPGVVVKLKHETMEMMVTARGETGVWLGCVERWVSFRELFELYTLEDGSPCGMED